MTRENDEKTFIMTGEVTDTGATIPFMAVEVSITGTGPNTY